VNIAAAIIAMRIVFFIAVPPKESGKSAVRTSDACLGTITAGLRHQLRARQDPRNDKLFGRNNLVVAL
jgi:hypothetical protein